VSPPDRLISDVRDPIFLGSDDPIESEFTYWLKFLIFATYSTLLSLQESVLLCGVITGCLWLSPARCLQFTTDIPFLRYGWAGCTHRLKKGFLQLLTSDNHVHPALRSGNCVLEDFWAFGIGFVLFVDSSIVRSSQGGRETKFLIPVLSSGQCPRWHMQCKIT
jgi:hypothetical protein